MSFANLSPLAVVAGLLALIGLFALLQILRLRYRPLPVVTTLFWESALREAPMRVFAQRLRHWLALLLICAIGGLLWLAFAEPEPNVAQDGGTRYVLYLDGSADMGAPADFNRALGALRADLKRLPADRREVIWGGPEPLMLLAPHEEPVLFERRLANLSPVAAPSRVEDFIGLLARRHGQGGKTELVIYGHAVPSEQALKNLPEGMKITSGVEMPESPANGAILSVGLADAASGRWDRVDALVRLAAPEGGRLASQDVTITLGDARIDEGRAETLSGNRLLLRDLPTNGGTLRVALRASDANMLDNRASIALPRRTRIAVAISPSVGAAVRQAVGADRSLRIVEPGNAQVVIRRAGEDFGANLPSLEFTPRTEQDSAFDLYYDASMGTDAEAVLRDNISALGLDQIDAAGLAAKTNLPIAIEAAPADRRGVSIWAELLDPHYNFTESRSFPLFVSGSAHWLAGDGAWQVPAVGADRDPNAVVVNAETAGLASSKASLERASFGAGAIPGLSDLWIWLALLALALLGLEWRLFQRGLMP